jgi:hypothetical protein
MTALEFNGHMVGSATELLCIWFMPAANLSRSRPSDIDQEEALLGHTKVVVIREGVLWQDICPCILPQMSDCGPSMTRAAQLSKEPNNEERKKSSECQ